MKEGIHHSESDADLEKTIAHQAERIQDGPLTAEEAVFIASFTDDQRKAVLRKVDWRLVPVLLVLYLIAFIDRANIGAAALCV